MGQALRKFGRVTVPLSAKEHECVNTVPHHTVRGKITPNNPLLPAPQTPEPSNCSTISLATVTTPSRGVSSDLIQPQGAAACFYKGALTGGINLGMEQYSPLTAITKHT